MKFKQVQLQLHGTVHYKMKIIQIPQIYLLIIQINTQLKNPINQMSP